MRDASSFVYRAGYPRICGADHGTAGFDAAKNGVRQMLLRAGRFLEPAVVRHVDENRRAAEDKVPGQLADRVFEANERRELDTVGQSKNRVLRSGGKIFRHLADDLREKGNDMSAR